MNFHHYRPLPGILTTLAGLALLLPSNVWAQKTAGGSVTGVVINQGANHPLESVTVTLKKTADDALVQTTVTDSQGRFSLESIPAGDYRVSYGYIGSDSKETKPFRVEAQTKALDLGRLDIGEAVLQLEKLQVKGKQREFYNTIDRKVYTVGREIQSATGSASDLLQNIPSVDVDIDGNVSLRGSDNVMILINGRTSALMGKSRAEVLQQLPADSIDKIEVITNPSAKYKPDGTAGIINIALKQKHDGGISSTVNASIGNKNRYNAGVSINYSPGKLNLFGSYSLRQDDRPRRASDIRTITDPATGTATTLDKRSVEHSRPLTHIVRAGIDYSPDKNNKLGVSANYSHRSFKRSATDHNVISDGTSTSDYDRTRYDPEYQRSTEFAANYQHTFPEEDHELTLEFKSSRSTEQEDNHYADIFRTPVQATTFDNTLIHPAERETEAVVEYVRPLSEDSKLEAGYTRTDEHLDTNFAVSGLNPATGLFVNDATRSNRFAYARVIHAFYVTYARSFEHFGFLAGLRPEQAHTRSRLVNTGEVITNDYFRVYPSLHLSYKLAKQQELQLNYSHRVHRPESDDLNPFPEYSDPYTLRAGNPRLKPEDIHSVEAGYQFKTDKQSFTATVYHRYLYNGFTNVTRNIGNSILLTTHENLATSRSTGLELTANTDLGRHLSVNFSSNTYFNTIDASNLGFTGSKSDISWTAKLGASVHLPKSTLLQFNANYASTRLTPQGSRRPTFVANLGKEEITRRRSARIIYLGFSYNFGKQARKPKDDTLKFDEQI